jgi:hypothetical protein
MRITNGFRVTIEGRQYRLYAELDEKENYECLSFCQARGSAWNNGTKKIEKRIRKGTASGSERQNLEIARDISLGCKLDEQHAYAFAEAVVRIASEEPIATDFVLKNLRWDDGSICTFLYLSTIAYRRKNDE